MYSAQYVTKKRLYALLVATVFIFFVIFCKIFYIQIVWGKNLQARASEQWARDLPLTALRGNITDANGIVLATSQTSFSVYIRAKNVENAESVAKVLSDTLGIDYDAVYKKASNKNVGEATIKRQVSAQLADEIRKHDLKGVYLAEDSSRVYPYGDYLSQILGFVSIDNVGQSGIEAKYDNYLKGINGKILTQSDLIGKELYDKSMIYLPSIKGLNVNLTIDYNIQTVLENVLQKVLLGHKAIGARSIVINCKTGEILALAAKPSIDLNNLPRDDIANLIAGTKNLLVTDVYEPGSTFKVLTAAANMEEYSLGNKKAFAPDHIFDNSNFRVVDGGKIKCWTKHSGTKHHNQKLSDALNNSCNPCFTDIGLSLGKDTMYKYLKAFGYGSVTGVDISGEQAGILVEQGAVTNGDLARISFGQTIAVTPIQLAYATAAAVNGGKLLTPYLVKSITDDTGRTIKRFYPAIKSQPISAQTSKTLALMLEGVVKNGSGKLAYIDGYRVGGKTGTAQKYKNGVIAQGKNVASFVGFFPANDPEYLCLMIVDEPQGVTYGSQVAAPYAKLVFEQIIAYKKIPKLT